MDLSCWWCFRLFKFWGVHRENSDLQCHCWECSSSGWSDQLSGGESLSVRKHSWYTGVFVSNRIMSTVSSSTLSSWKLLDEGSNPGHPSSSSSSSQYHWPGQTSWLLQIVSERSVSSIQTRRGNFQLWLEYKTTVSGYNNSDIIYASSILPFFSFYRVQMDLM